MATIEELVGQLLAVREKLQLCSAPTEAIRQAVAEASGNLQQIGADYYGSVANELAHASDLANQSWEQVASAIEWVNSEIAYLQTRR